MMKITRESPLTGKTTTLELDVTPDEYHAWRTGTLIQNAMPRLNDDEREFILSGCLPGEFEQFVEPEKPESAELSDEDDSPAF